MDLFEKLFQWGSNKLKPKKQAQIDNHMCTLSLLACAAARGCPLELRPTSGHAVLEGQVLWIPAYEQHLPTLFAQALVAGARSRLGNVSIDTIDDYLRSEFAGYLAWRQSIPQLPDIEVRNADMPSENNAVLSAGKKESSTGTELEREFSEQIKVIDLDKERQDNNPVMHSFEKMETADDYRGGHRIADGDDELASHENALKELKLDTVTRSGPAAQSLYKADMMSYLTSRFSSKTRARDQEFELYPEWNHQKKELLQDHCRLYVDSPWIAASATPPRNDDGKALLKEKHGSELNRFMNLLAQVRNRRAWTPRQWEGERLDIDDYIKYISDLRSVGQGDPRVFRRHLLGSRDISTFILFDQSSSTDSFVSGKRILDVERESIGLAGILLDEVSDPVAVAGTWSETRSHCYFRCYKTFSQPWTHWFASESQIEPIGYTRLGPSIRHATKLLKKTSSQSKLLLLITDGKPTDYDRYEGVYGLEDIRHAFLEARQQGVHVKTLIIAGDVKHYFPAVFGRGHYQLLPKIEQLPEALFHAYLQASQH